MIRVFSKTRAKCSVCGSHMGGSNLRRIGDKYYCQSDYDKESIAEQIANNLQDNRFDAYRKWFAQGGTAFEEMWRRLSDSNWEDYNTDNWEDWETG